ncbi:MAG TPA: L,D-transpeptidase family protein [Candidatus Omnitrophota bacterium]|nr:L,D-transpeptidase family protein [Candidatus Omnitrophota bacterium]HSA30182.1 L,D-transpeptidase family protein [Candidatus Omnitrophota bacterium]
MNRNIFIAVIIGIAVIVFVLVLGKGKNGETAAPTVSPTVKQAQELYEQAQKIENKKPAEAKEIYKEILETYPDMENISKVQDQLHRLNMGLLFSKETVEGKTLVHEVVVGDTLGKIAKKYGTTIELIKKSNGLKSDIIRVGQRLRIWQGSFNIFVDKSQNILLLKDGNEVLKMYVVSTGENNSTPVGTFTVTSKLENPVWFNSGVVVPPESPQNVLGTRWLGFEEAPGYGIHGTVEPDKLGQQVTAGCVRMSNEDVEELYSIVPRGVKVTVVD